jgi:hypothetical protein
MQFPAAEEAENHCHILDQRKADETSPSTTNGGMLSKTKTNVNYARATISLF